MEKEVFAKVKGKMEETIRTYKRELGAVRTGRASLSLLDGITVDYYGTPTPLSQVASMTTPESRTILIQPWDKTIIKEIEKAIQKSNLGLQPMDDGKVVRITIPQLTEERRRELVKIAKKLAEDARVAARNVRREGNEEVKHLEKEKKITEDAHRKARRRDSEDHRRLHSRDRRDREVEGKGDHGSLTAPGRRGSRIKDGDHGDPGEQPASACGHHHGRQRPLGQAPFPPADGGTPRGGQGRQADPSRGRCPGHRPLDPVHLLARELGPAGRGGRRTDAPSRRHTSRGRSPPCSRRGSAWTPWGCSNGCRMMCGRPWNGSGLPPRAGHAWRCTCALSYGGRQEIVEAAELASRDPRPLDPGDREAVRRRFVDHLRGKDLPPVDLLIRTSGERRISNFLLWHLPGAFLHFTGVLWPDFNRRHLAAAIDAYRSSGGLPPAGIGA